MYIEIAPGTYIAVEHIISASLSENAGYAEIVTSDLHAVSNEDGNMTATSRIHKIQDAAAVKTLQDWLDTRSWQGGLIGHPATRYHEIKSRIDGGERWFADTGAKTVRLWRQEGEYRVTCADGTETIGEPHQDFGEALADVVLHIGVLR